MGAAFAAWAKTSRSVVTMLDWREVALWPWFSVRKKGLLSSDWFVLVLLAWNLRHLLLVGEEVEDGDDRYHALCGSMISCQLSHDFPARLTVRGRSWVIKAEPTSCILSRLGSIHGSCLLSLHRGQHSSGKHDP